MKILICGLPGSGKTTLARELAYHFLIPHHNGDTYREYNDDWDFSISGRMRQARRMYLQWGILDFVCPTNHIRELINPSFVIWMDTIKESDYKDTNDLFEKPVYNIRIKKWIGQNQLHKCLEDFSPGTKGIQNFLNERLKKLAK
jgi:GTPase SAR1 family protein